MTQRVIAAAVLAAGLGLAACAATQAAEPPAVAAAPAAPAAFDPAAVEAERTARMAALKMLVGTWTGEGWRNLPSGRVTFAQTVIVEEKVGGLALSIQGQSRRTDGTPPGGGSFAVVTWDGAAKRYPFRSFVGGVMTEAEAQLIAPDTFQWLAKIPGSWLRFTVKISGDTWDEKGERSTDNGATWTPTNEVKLTRAKV